MKGSPKIIIDILIAIAISLVVNFSHLLLIFIYQEPMPAPADPQREYRAAEAEAGDNPDNRIEGLFARRPNGHGYIIYNDGIDSAYVSLGKATRYSLRDGDRVVATVNREPQEQVRNEVVQYVLRRNDDQITHYTSSTPQRTSDFVTQLIYYFALSLIVIMIATMRYGRTSRGANLRRLLLAVLLAVALYFVAPLVSPRQRGEFIFTLLMRNRPIVDLMVTLKWSFAVIVSLLYSQIFTLISQRQNIIVENEKLRSENINAQYNMLMSQINPHVLFNSLNSLSMLIREHDEQRSLTYVDQLSYTFRYILQNRESTLTTLAEEMDFVEAYIYLFKIRYADKLFFDIDIDERYNLYQIPALSLQPLLDNAVKHNTILSSRPFHVSIIVEGDVLIVSNRKYPKLDAEPSTGVGLENLCRRWALIAHSEVTIEQDEEFFTVKLPLIKPAQ